MALSWWGKCPTALFKPLAFLDIFSLLMSVAVLVARLKPLTYRWWGKCSTTVLQKLVLRRQLILSLFSQNVIGSAWVQTHSLWMKRQVSHCSTKAATLFDIFSLLMSVAVLVAGLKPLTYGWWCKSTTTVLQKLVLRRVLIVHFFSLSVIGSGWAQTYGLELMRQVSYCCTKATSLFQNFLSSDVSSGIGSWTQTIDLQMMRQCFCQCAGETGIE